MFDSLSDRMRQDEQEQTNASERLIRRVAMVVVSVLVFGGLYFAIKMLE